MAWTNPPRTWSTGELVSAVQLNTELRDQLISILPTGTLILRVAAYATVETAVEGRWLQCNGVAVSRTTYATLFNYLNSLSPALPFGTGDGSTTFNLPDLRGRTVYAEGEHTDVDVIGDSDGAAIANRTPSHFHVQSHRDGTGGSDALRGGNNVLQFLGNTSGSGVQDKPAYLVVGSYFIKYT